MAQEGTVRDRRLTHNLPRTVCAMLAWEALRRVPVVKSYLI